MNRFVLIMILAAAPAYAQSSEPVTVAASFDVRNVYMFRGVRQDDTGTIFGPAVDVGIRLDTHARVHVGSWNSLHSGWTGSHGPSGKRWYESDFYVSAPLEFADGAAVTPAYTVYRSPNDMFTTVKELSIKAASTRWFMKPYALVAFELGTHPGTGQLDGGFEAGRYLELGATPARTIGRIAVAMPVRMGFSAGNYYELAGKDRRFGFASAGGVATVSLARWLNVHGGIEVQRLGEATKAFNGGDASKTVALVGIGFAR